MHYLNIPEVVPSPWFCVDLSVEPPIILIDFLHVPLEVPYNLQLSKVVHYTAGTGVQPELEYAGNMSRLG